jgi:hypothetical protein
VLLIHSRNIVLFLYVFIGLYDCSRDSYESYLNDDSIAAERSWRSEPFKKCFLCGLSIASLCFLFNCLSPFVRSFIIIKEAKTVVNLDLYGKPLELF